MPPEEGGALFSAVMWLEYAEEDLGAAHSLLSLGYFRSACSRAQQGTEKDLQQLLDYLRWFDKSRLALVSEPKWVVGLIRAYSQRTDRLSGNRISESPVDNKRLLTDDPPAAIFLQKEVVSNLQL